MNTLNKILVGLLAVQLVAFVVGQFSGTASARRTVPQPLLSALEANKVTKIEILGKPKKEDSDPKQESMTLEKVNGKWGVATADQYPVNAEKVKELTEKLEYSVRAAARSSPSANCSLSARL